MPKDLTCPVCGKTQRMQSNAKYCSDKCRQKKFRDSKKQESEK